jgi:hypothetical protein
MNLLPAKVYQLADPALILARIRPRQDVPANQYSC